jgi:hypothetical protein
MAWADMPFPSQILLVTLFCGAVLILLAVIVVAMAAVLRWGGLA